MQQDATFAVWERRAKRRLPKFVFDYVEGGADSEDGLRRNLETIRQFRLLPDRLTDVVSCNVESSLFGMKVDFPVVVAPTGLNGLLWPEGDIALARAASQANIPFVLSMASTSTIEAVTRSCPGQKWFQLYVLEDRKISEDVLARAEAAGFQALVVTVDVPINGNRTRDIRNRFKAPMSVGPRAICDMLMHPRWLLQIATSGVPDLVNIRARGEDSLTAKSALLQRKMDRSLCWSSIDWIRAHWRGPIVLKGIMSSNDAVRSQECGIDGIVVSNHGGRQLDSAAASIEVLEGIVDRISSKRLSVMIDSGFRSGADVVKALALGAKAVMVGRPMLYGLASAGQFGAFSVLSKIKNDVESTLTLMGLSNLDQLQRRHLLAPRDAVK